MFKKLVCLILCLVFIASSSALADVPDVSTLTAEEKAELLDLLLTESEAGVINEAITKRMTTFTDDLLLALRDLILAEIDTRGIGQPIEVLQKGSNGENVRLLQARLIELSYLSGSADGAFGNKTAEAVKLFQKEVGLTQTGIADEETQNALFAEDAPVATVYLTIDYDAMSRDPANYEGKNYTFTGKVLQVMEQTESYGTLVAMRVATKGNYDNVIYVIYLRPDGESRILEDDRITVYGTSGGLYTYETVRGDEISIPLISAESVSLN